MNEEIFTDEEINEIDDIIEQVAAEIIEEKKEEETSIVPSSVKSDDDLINLTLEKNGEVEELANKAFQLFFGDLSRGIDHASSSKEQMLEALKVRVELNKTIVELAKLKKKQDNNIGVLINTVPAHEVGIDMKKIQKEFT